LHRIRVECHRNDLVSISGNFVKLVLMNCVTVPADEAEHRRLARTGLGQAQQQPYSGGLARADRITLACKENSTRLALSLPFWKRGASNRINLGQQRPMISWATLRTI
jgi:hypothetical protein